ncbi:MAG: nickel-dependent lactate racemase [Thermoplasmata archaeon]|nr:nickel-dependent lactate racemase [Thermoplasmata archaeon]
MRVEVPYGDGTLSATIPESAHVTVLEPKEVPQKDEIGLLKEAVSDPISFKPLSEFLSGCNEFLVVVNDATRQTPTAKALEGLSEILRDKKPEFLVATGSHRAPTEDEIRSILGDFHRDFRDRIGYHDARNSEMVELGITSRGTPVKVNKKILEFDRVVLINSVEPHYFAGYTGGRKSILPGVSSYETIEANHKFALEPTAKTMSLEGNPVHEDMIEAIGFLDSDKLFSINLVLDGQKRIFFVGAGDIEDSFMEAVEYSHEVNSIPVRGPADLVVTATSPPSDIDLYQSQKALDNAKLVARKGGTIIFATKCREGIGKRKFFDLIAEEDNPASVLEKLKSGYELGWHKAAKMAEMAVEFQILAITALPPEDIRSIFMNPFSDLQSAIDHALESLGKASSIVVMPMGGLTVPRVRE